MSEPVGNAPRSDAVPSNTIKDREKKTVGGTATPNAAAVTSPTPVEDREPAEKIVKGVVTARKIAWWRRMGRSIFAEDLSSIGDFLYTDLIIPTIRNSIRELVMGATDRALFGSKMGPARRGPLGGIGGQVMGLSGQVSNFGTRYDRMSEGTKVISREAQARHDFTELAFASREDALIVLEDLISRIERYRIATVADLYNACGVSNSDYAALNHGWNDLSTAAVRQRYGGFLLDLPAPEPIRN